MSKQATHCAYCGKYVRPDSPQRYVSAYGPEEEEYEILCLRCEKELDK